MSPLLATAAIAAVFAALLTITIAELPAARAVRDLLYDHTQKAMLLVAGVATGGSLYYSEVVDFIPCEFCWFQRIAMYPIFALLAVAVVSRTRMPSRYIITLAAIGLALSIYHYQLQLFPEQGGTCSGPVSCTGKYVEEFGFVTIPFMAGSGFLSILLLQVAEWRTGQLSRRWDEVQ